MTETEKKQIVALVKHELTATIRKIQVEQQIDSMPEIVFLALAHQGLIQTNLDLECQIKALNPKANPYEQQGEPLRRKMPAPQAIDVSDEN